MPGKNQTSPSLLVESCLLVVVKGFCIGISIAIAYFYVYIISTMYIYIYIYILLYTYVYTHNLHLLFPAVRETLDADILSPTPPVVRVRGNYNIISYNITYTNIT